MAANDTTRPGSAVRTEAVRRGAVALLCAAGLAAAIGAQAGPAAAAVRPSGAAAARLANAATGGWTVQPTPNGADLTRLFFAVSCSSARACTAVGERAGHSVLAPLAERWDGVKWTVQHLPGRDASLGGVSCPAARDCVAVGGGVADLAEHWNGSRWAVQPTPDPQGAARSGRQISLASVACPALAFCVAVGGYLDTHRNQRPLALVWNGQRWHIVTGMPGPPGLGTLTGVSCSGRSACTAVGDFYTGNAISQGYAERWNGHRWSEQPLPRARHRNAIVAAVSCPGARFCVAAGTAVTASGGYELTERWNGTGWSASQAAAAPGQAAAPGGGFTGVSCHSASWCVAVGSYGDAHARTHTLAERWNGRRWVVQRTQDPSPYDSVFNAVSCPAGGSACTAAGEAISGTGTLALAERDGAE